MTTCHSDKWVDPAHHKDYYGGAQWIDVMNRIAPFRDRVKFHGALELQARKYLDRCGRKDDPAQEIGKCLFYLLYWYADMNNLGMDASDIHEWMRAPIYLDAPIDSSETKKLLGYYEMEARDALDKGDLKYCIAFVRKMLEILKGRHMSLAFVIDWVERVK